MLHRLSRVDVGLLKHRMLAGLLMAASVHPSFPTVKPPMFQLSRSQLPMLPEASQSPYMGGWGLVGMDAGPSVASSKTSIASGTTTGGTSTWGAGGGGGAEGPGLSQGGGGG